MRHDRPGDSSMASRKRRLTAAEKAARKRRRQETRTIFVNGKQKRVPRPATVDGMDVDEFIRRNADPIWLHQNENWGQLADDALSGDGRRMVDVARRPEQACHSRHDLAPEAREHARKALPVPRPIGTQT